MRKTLSRAGRLVIAVTLTAALGMSARGDVVDTRLGQLIQRHIDAPWPDPNDPSDPWGLATYALAALYANQNVALANTYIERIHDDFNVPTNGDAPPDFPVYFKLHLLWRIYCDSNMNARLTTTARDDIEDMMWRWVNERSQISQAEGGAWQIHDSENHDAMQKGSFLLCCQALRKAGAPYGSDRTLQDGSTLQQHYEAWTAYWYEYFRQRAREGINCEIASPTYAKYTVGVYYNIRDYTEAPTLREMAERFINLYWADTACDFLLSGVRGGAETRCYKDDSLYRGDQGSFGPLLWAYTWHTNFNPVSGTSPFTLITAMSSYRVPEIITACATNTDKPPYLYTSRRFGLTDAIVIDGINKVIFRPGMASDLRRESFITKDYAMGTLTLNQTNDYIQLIDQNRAMGIMFASGVNDRIMVHGEGESPDFIKGYREITGVCRTNCMVVSRDRNAPAGADTYVFVSPGSVWGNRNETNGWFFTRTGNAYCGIKPATGGYTVSNLSYGFLLVLGDNFAPIVIQSGQAQDYGGSFAAFQAHVTNNTFTYVSSVLTYVSEAGDAFAVGRKTYNTPVINGTVEDLNPPKTYDSPYLSMVHGESVATFGYGSYTNLVLDFDVPAPPAVAANPATGIGLTNATLNGALLVAGGSPPDVLLYWDVVDRGATNAGWAHTNDLGSYEVGSVSTNLTGLTPNVRYFYRFCATNAYGADWSFSTNFVTLGKPVVSNAPATGIGEADATLNGTLLDRAGMPTEVYLFWGVSNGITDGNWGHTNSFGFRDVGPLTTNVAGLSPNTRYYYAFYATNTYGYGWAAVSNFTTVGAPALTNYAVTGLEMTNATFNGELLDDSGLPTHVYLFWSTTSKTTNSVNWPNTNDFGIIGVGPLTTTVTRLTPDRKHWYAFYATNAYGFNWTKVATFNTKGPPSIQNDPATGIGVSNAVLNGTVNSTGGVPTQVYVFWDTADRGTNAAGWARTNAFGTQKEVSLATNITGLIPDTSYAYRFYATNQYGGTWATSAAGFKTLLTPNYLWFEAESGVITPPMIVAADSNASGGAFVWVPDTPINSGGRITFPFSILVATNYALWVRVNYSDGGANSFLYCMDGGSNMAVQGATTVSWSWQVIPTNYPLNAGSHAIVIANREDGSKLDCFMLTSDTNYIPTNVVSSVPADSDADGMPDVWMQQYFHQPTGQVGNLSRPDDDQDGDGLDTWGEYVAGSNPTNRSDCAGLLLVWTNGQWALRFTARQTAGFGYAGLQRYFHLGSCGDLAAAEWNGLPGETNVLATGQTVIYPFPPPAAQAFYRLLFELR